MRDAWFNGMFTSYFARIRLGIAYPVSICRWPPRWYTGPRYPKLAPPEDILLRAKRNAEELKRDTLKFQEEYRREVLNKLDFNTVVADLSAIYHDVDLSELTLLCYEQLNKHCHSHWVAEWFNEQGVICREWTPTSSEPCLPF